MFEVFMFGAQERFIDRALTHFEGQDNALSAFADPEIGKSKLVVDFVDALFCDFSFDNIGGACFVLQALANRPVEINCIKGTIGDVLLQLAKSTFTELLIKRCFEGLELIASYDFRPSAI